MTYRIVQGDVIKRLRELPDESVHCVVTSPPYWGLRDYGVKGQIGLEKTPAQYLTKMVAVFREVRRVLRADGTCWVNMGDSYISSATGTTSQAASTLGGGKANQLEACKRPNKSAEGLKSKDLCGMPWRLAFALQEDGWWLRQDIIWAKPNPMPESVTDRCTKAHEYIFLLTKSARYFYDAEAIKEPANGWNDSAFDDGKNLVVHPNVGKKRTRGNQDWPKASGVHGHPQQDSNGGGVGGNGQTRNKRSVWEIATEAFPEAHFATFPTKLVEPCILAGTSETGCCDRCQASYVRIVDREFIPQGDVNEADGVRGAGEQKPMDESNGREGFPRGTSSTKTTGWEPNCKCSLAWAIPCTVLDPFNGSGTTGVVALRYHRNYIGIELNPEYAAMAERRIHGDNPMFNRQEEQVPA